MYPGTRDFILGLYKSTKKRNYIRKLAKGCDMTVSHLSHLKYDLMENDILNEEIEGRVKLVSLTPKGIAIAEQLDIIDHHIKGIY